MGVFFGCNVILGAVQHFKLVLCTGTVELKFASTQVLFSCLLLCGILLFWQLENLRIGGATMRLNEHISCRLYCGKTTFTKLRIRNLDVAHGLCYIIYGSGKNCGKFMCTKLPAVGIPMSTKLSTR